MIGFGLVFLGCPTEDGSLHCNYTTLLVAAMAGRQRYIWARRGAWEGTRPEVADGVL